MTLNNSIHNKQSLAALIVAMLAFGFFLVQPARAASFSLAASSNKVTIGSSFTVNLYLSTQGKSVNNAEANIKFSNDLVDVVSVKGALFSLWVENPSFSNSTGRISFNGGIPAPGYNGNNGRVLSIVVRAKKSGTASFSFSSAAIRENDGLGTDILTSKSAASVSIVPIANTAESQDKPAASNAPDKIAKPASAVTALAAASSLPALAVSSPTYSAQEWSPAKKGLVSWQVPSGASAVQTLVDHSPYSLPSITYNTPIYNKNLSDLSDGIWYFHVRYLLDNKWSAVSNYKIQVDSTPPSNLSVVPEKNGNNCVAGLKIAARDAVSGIDYYNIYIDDHQPIKVLAANSGNTIPWPHVEAGIHRILVAVYDKAGNKAETSSAITTEKLNAPALVSLPDSLSVGDKLQISGRSDYAQAPFKLTISSPETSKVFDLVSDDLGKLSFTSQPLTVAGRYQVSAYALGCNEESNSNTVQTSVEVKEAPSILKLAATRIKTAKDYSILWNIFKVILLFVLLLGWYKYVSVRRRLLSTKKRAGHVSVDILLEEANQELSILEKAQKKKNLTKNEEKSLTRLKQIMIDIDKINRNKK